MKYGTMERKITKLIHQLAKQVINLPQPIHILAICSGGRTVGKYIYKYLKDKRINASYFEVWTNIIGKRASILKTNFKKKDYKGTVLIVEDVIWKGTSLMAVKKMIRSMSKKKFYIPVLLDFNHRADFSVFH